MGFSCIIPINPFTESTMKPLVVFILAIAFLTACASSSQTPSQTSQLSTQPTPDYSILPMVYIKSLYERDGGGKFMKFDNVEMLQGEEAIIAAIEDTKCPREKITDGNCAPSLNNNFYIRDKGERNNSLELSKDVKIFNASGAEITYAELKAYSSLEATPFYIEEADGKVITLIEQYLP